MRLDPVLETCYPQRFTITGVLYWGGSGNGGRLELEFPGARFLGLPEQKGTTNSVTETTVYSPHPLEARIPKSVCGQGWSLFSKESLIQVILPASGGQQPLDCTHLTLVSPASSHSCPFPWIIPLPNLDSRHWIPRPIT